MAVSHNDPQLLTRIILRPVGSDLAQCPERLISDGRPIRALCPLVVLCPEPRFMNVKEVSGHLSGLPSSHRAGEAIWRQAQRLSWPVLYMHKQTT
jgi:hypothetical protein